MSAEPKTFNIRDAIVKSAMEFEGEEEIRGNLGFQSPEFQEIMETMGWEKRQAWCAYLAEAIWKYGYASYNSSIVDKLDTLFSPSAVITYRQFSKHPEFELSQEPEPGDLVVWQRFNNGSAHWTGHIGVVVELMEGKRKVFYSMEGNTNDNGSREGYGVFKRKRSHNKASFDINHGLRLLGFIKPIDASFEVKSDT